MRLAGTEVTGFTDKTPARTRKPLLQSDLGLALLRTEVATLTYKALTRARKPILRTDVGLAVFRFVHRNRQSFLCPICNYSGPFADLYPETRVRRHASCPRCGSAERHRLQYLILQELAPRFDYATMSVLHVAPEPFFARHFKRTFRSYTSTDLSRNNVDYRADLCALPFADCSFDLVFASHVLEHIKDDRQAIAEIERVMRPGGIAVLPVPILSPTTVEYPVPNPHEAGHVRAPGADYYERLYPYFKKVELYHSNSFQHHFQVFIYEDRTAWPKTMPLRPTTNGAKHPDVVPVCFK